MKTQSGRANCRPQPILPAVMVATMALVCSSNAQAQVQWPTREIRVIAPFAAGSGGTDAVARLMTEKLREIWGHPVVLENVPGAAGTIGVGKLARSAPDGHTIVLSGDAAIVVAPSMYKSLPYDPLKDLVPIIQVGRTTNLLVVNKDGPASLKELVARAKERPGTLTFNSTGFGTSQHMGYEQLKRMAAIDIVHVPSRGQTAPDILGGHVTASFMNILIALPHVKSGALRALGASGRERSPAAPDIPTVAEQGYPGFDATPWFGFFAPAGTPDSIIRKINSDVAKALADAAFTARLEQFGFEIEKNSTPESFAAFIKREIPRIGEIVTASGIKLD